MNLRYAPVLALAGWYLMVPPMDDNHKIHSNLPLSQWQMIDSFDSAQECKAVLGEMWTRANNQGGWRKERMDASQCYSNSDPRLKGQ
jgi:hypothetical protein